MSNLGRIMAGQNNPRESAAYWDNLTRSSVSGLRDDQVKAIAAYAASETVAGRNPNVWHSAFLVCGWKICHCRPCTDAALKSTKESKA